VLDLEADPRATRDAITQVARKAVAEDRAEVICLGCAGMSGLADAVAESVGVPVVHGVPAAVHRGIAA